MAMAMAQQHSHVQWTAQLVTNKVKLEATEKCDKKNCNLYDTVAMSDKGKLFILKLIHMMGSEQREKNGLVGWLRRVG